MEMKNEARWPAFLLIFETGNCGLNKTGSVSVELILSVVIS